MGGRSLCVMPIPLHWALLTVWDGDADVRRFAAGTTHRRWNRLADERLDVLMTPLASRGRWAGREPFGVPSVGARRTAGVGVGAEVGANGVRGTNGGGSIAAITRARLRVGRAVSFWRAVPPVSADLAGVDGLRLAIGIGEAPIGLQGTFSLWQSADQLNEFAYRRPAHREVVSRTERERWYAEELFARFAVRSVEGTFEGRRPLAD